MIMYYPYGKMPFAWFYIYPHYIIYFPLRTSVTHIALMVPPVLSTLNGSNSPFLAASFPQNFPADSRWCHGSRSSSLKAQPPWTPKSWWVAWQCPCQRRRRRRPEGGGPLPWGNPNFTGQIGAPNFVASVGRFLDHLATGSSPSGR